MSQHAILEGHMPHVAFYYFTWHYSRGLQDFMRVWGNFFWFFWNLFSVSLMIRTFFLPFHRIRETPKHKLDVEEIASSLIVNILMRLVGMVLRFSFIVLGVMSLAVTAVLGSALFLLWIFAPLVLGFLVVVGCVLIVPLFPL